MTNDQNVVRARHVESLAADLSDFVTQSNDDLHQAVQAELAEFDTGGNSAVILGSDSSTFDGTLWLEDVTNAAPVVKLYHGGNVYDFATTPDFTVIDHSAATVGKNFNVKSSVTSVIGSAFNDSISVSGSNNRIVETSGNNYVSVSGSGNTIIGGSGKDNVYFMDNASLNSVYLPNSNNYVYNYNTSTSRSKNSTVIFGAGNDKINFGSGFDSCYVNFGGGNNTLYAASANSSRHIDDSTIICGTGNDSIDLGSKSKRDLVELTGGDNNFYATAPYAVTVYGGTGNDTITFSSYTNGTGATINAIHLAKGNNAVYISRGTCNTIIGGTGNDSINTADNSSLNHIELTAGRNTVSLRDSGDTIIGGTGDDFIKCFSTASLNHIELTAGNNTVSLSAGSNTIYCGTGNDSIRVLSPATIYYFADNDTLALPTGKSTTWKSSLNNETVKITVNGNADSVITCQNYTATQFHIESAGVANVYTIQGSEFVLAGGGD